ncbi:hypothetical protein [Allonocardiopsis opalescens]|uniref:Uncharacterized protein n=1 Tax=Allonocardiopsis opalescens TaxID=1144618 RepID=A0A2T0QA63_9ACTN|nr:hypothetical protein [Allonocardiopsis opalescens]PRY00710.1 hypothetical protein CLV72_102342 [Allonocardiopsis opalescens]
MSTDSPERPPETSEPPGAPPPALPLGEPREPQEPVAGDPEPVATPPALPAPAPPGDPVPDGPPPAAEPPAPAQPAPAIDPGEDAFSDNAFRQRGLEREQRLAGFDNRTVIGSVVITDGQGISFGGGPDGGGRHERPGPVDPDRLREDARTYVATRSDPQLRMLLDTLSLVFLTGPASTGRHASAGDALARWSLRTERDPLVAVLHPQSPFGTLTARLRPGHGHVLDATGQMWPATVPDAEVKEVQSWLRQNRASLVVLIDEPNPVTEVRQYQLHHQPAAPERILRAHLRHCLDAPEQDGAVLAAAREDAETRDWLDELTAPAECVELASVLADWWRTGRGAPPAVRQVRHRLLCHQARELLRAAPAVESPTQQAYALAGAVLDRHELNTVIRAAGRLAELLRATENPHGSRGRQVFTDPLHNRTRHIRIVAARSAGPATGGSVRQLVRMKQPRLAGALVDVAWSEFDACRGPLLDWLRELCLDHDTRVRISAAQTLGRLAGIDFAEIKREVLDAWAGSVRPAHHQAAAWLLEKAVKDGARADEARAVLRRWARSGDRLQVLIALRAYGTEIGRDDPQEALRGIREVVLARRWTRGRPGQVLRPDVRWLVSSALAEIYTAGPDQRGEVLSELLAWARRDPAVTPQVTQALMLIALLPADPGGSGADGAPRRPERYDLLSWLADPPDGSAGTVPVEDIVQLWRTALVDAHLFHHAWRFLISWDRSAAPGTPERAYMHDLFARLAADPRLRSRIAFYREFRRHRAAGEGTR